MNKKIVLLCVAAFAMAGVVQAEWLVIESGKWPKCWPKELEPLRKESRTLSGSLADLTVYEIPFTDRDEFEAAWPLLLKLKTQGAPVFLVRGPNKFLVNAMKAGVRVHCPPGKTGEAVPPSKPLPNRKDPRSAWIKTNYIELVVDGKIVDLNTIPLPADTPIIDERFEKKK